MITQDNPLLQPVRCFFTLSSARSLAFCIISALVCFGGQPTHASGTTGVLDPSRPGLLPMPQEIE